MTNSAYHSTVLEQSAKQTWDVVRDFNSYPKWVDGVDASHIEEDLSGTTVGAVRNFSMGSFSTRQRLLAHSDVDRYFTYESCSSFALTAGGVDRTLSHYAGTLRIRPVVDGDRAFAEWSVQYECPPEQAGYWSAWWAEALPVWMNSLRDHLAAA